MFKFLNNPLFALINLIGAIITITSSIFLVANENYNYSAVFYSIIFLVILFVVFLTIFGASYYKKYKIKKEIEKEINNLTSNVKKHINDIAYTDDLTQAKEILERNIIRILNTIERVFSTLENKRCTASIMLYNKDVKKFQTYLYGENVDDKRSETKSNGVNVNKNARNSIANSAFFDKEIQCWDKSRDKYSGFEQNRKNFRDFYNSGITTAITFEIDAVGVLNVDCFEDKVFNLKDHEVLMRVFRDVINIVIMILEGKEVKEIEVDLKKIKKKLKE